MGSLLSYVYLGYCIYAYGTTKGDLNPMPTQKNMAGAILPFNVRRMPTGISRKINFYDTFESCGILMKSTYFHI